MVRNLGMLERVFRLVVGLMILGLFGALAEPWRYLTLIGLIPLATALTGRCPIYHVLGWKRSDA
jgi:hypothetical protein